MNKLMLCLLGFIGGIFMAFWRGFVFSKLWLWFVVPNFALAPIGYVVSSGIMLLVGYATYQISKEDIQGEMAIEKFVFNLVFPAIILLSGWIYTFFL